uniref:Uncharacterized protein n=1 Tax=Nelumbo nucifera TaxID=4432 RepID=A0A822Z1Q3_NELNU|nr:TPA_asm: hypothetical protein HUJ06_009084 [Nelumbo nucifera]
MASWLQKMKDSNISFSIRTYNSSCPTITSLLKDLKSVPLSMEDLKGRLQKDETLSVEQVIGYSWVQVLRSRFRAGSWVTPTKFRVICGSEKHSSVKGESPGKALVKQMMVQMRSPMKIDPTNVGCFVGKGKAVRDWLRSGGWEREREREM